MAEACIDAEGDLELGLYTKPESHVALKSVEIPLFPAIEYLSAICERDHIQPGGAKACVRPIEKPDLVGGQQQIVGAHVEVQQGVADDRVWSTGLEIGQRLQVALRPGVQLAPVGCMFVRFGPKISRSRSLLEPGT